MRTLHSEAATPCKQGISNTTIHYPERTPKGKGNKKKAKRVAADQLD